MRGRVTVREKDMKWKNRRAGEKEGWKDGTREGVTRKEGGKEEG